MMTRRKSLIVTAAAAVVLMVWAGAYAASALQAQPTSVAVVNIEEVFNQLKEKQAIEANLRAQGDDLQAEEQAMKEKIGKLQEALKLLPPGGPGHAQKQEELEKAVLEFQVWGQFQQKKQQRERAVQIEGLYNKTIKTIGEIATESGYDLVLFEEPKPQFQGNNLQQIMAQLSLRKVLWAKDSIEITNTVTTRMNNEFDAGQ